MYRYNKELRSWLRGLCQDQLQQDEIVMGYIRHYVMNYCVLNDVEEDLLYCMGHGSRETQEAMRRLINALVSFSGAEQ